jgi:hypothetical protein
MAPFNNSDSNAHPIIFCGEYIPVDNDFVADKLMSVIKSQVRYVKYAVVAGIGRFIFWLCETTITTI